MNATRTMDEPKVVLSMVAFIRDPVLWLVAAGGSALSLALPQEIASAGHGVLLGAIALLGGFFGKVLQVWLEFRRQRAKEIEDQSARFERLLLQEQAMHQREQESVRARLVQEGERYERLLQKQREEFDRDQARSLARIETLETKLDGERGAAKIGPQRISSGSEETKPAL